MPIRRAIEADIPHMVAIAEAKRVAQEGYAPVFWRKAPHASPKHERYLQSLLTGTDVIALVAQGGNSLAGFALGALTTAPPVYNPGGPVCIVDDFAVVPSAEWHAVGSAFWAAMSREAQARGAVLMVVVCAQRDQAKRALLQEAGCSVASEWHVKPLQRHTHGRELSRQGSSAGPASNQGLQATADSLRSCLAAAIGGA